MSRQAGGQAAGGMGIGARGPGETKIELDRRRINTKIAKLKREIAAMKITRDTKRATRQNTQVPAVAIAGYTNAGKSSLLNRLTSAGVLVENALFATLDPTVRQCQTPDGRAFTVADTVGFVRSLPHQLVEAFRSTLEEIQAADLIIHVVDASDPDPAGQIAAVRQVIAEVEASAVLEILVLNKIDLVDQSTEIELRAKFPSALMISTRTGIGLDDLLERVQQELPAPDQHFVGRLPYTRGDLVSRIHLRGRVNSLSYEEDGTLIDAWVKADLLPELEAARVI
jgi:GTP-binding protein HflX